jgi:signal transduction histidine kinase
MFGFLFGRIVVIILLCFLPSWALHGLSLLDAIRSETERAEHEAVQALKIERVAIQDRLHRARALLRAAASDPRLVEGDDAACHGTLQGAFLEAGSFTFLARETAAGEIDCFAAARAGALPMAANFTARTAVVLEPNDPVLRLRQPLAGGGSAPALIGELSVRPDRPLSSSLVDAVLILAPLDGEGRFATIAGGSSKSTALASALTRALAAAKAEANPTLVDDEEGGFAAALRFEDAELPFALVIGVSGDYTTALGHRLLAAGFAAVGLTIVLIIAVAWFAYSGLIYRWIDALTWAQRRLQAGNLSARAGPPYGPGELGELARSFDHLVTSLQEREVQTNELRLRLVDAIESIPEGFLLCDAEDRVVLVNSKFAEFYPGTAQILRVGMTFADLVRGAAAIGEEGEEPPIDGKPNAVAIEEAVARRLAYRARPMGWLEDKMPSGRFFRSSDRRTERGWTVSVFSDVTALKRAELQLENRVEELERTRADLAFAKEAAERANAAKSSFLANMSHELRTPLNAVLGFSEIMRDERLGPIGAPIYRVYSRDIHDSGQLLLSLINDILDLSKIEAGKYDLHEETVSVSDIVGRALRLIRTRAAESRIALKAEVDGTLPLLLADQRALQQMLLNLLSNAIKFTPSGGSVTISARRRGGRLRLSIADTGIGVADADIEKILSPFGQVENIYSRRYQGTGLGLPMVKLLIELHGGSLSVASALGRGTIVSLDFPASRLLESSVARPQAL